MEVFWYCRLRLDLKYWSIYFGNISPIFRIFFSNISIFRVFEIFHLEWIYLNKEIASQAPRIGLLQSLTWPQMFIDKINICRNGPYGHILNVPSQNNSRRSMGISFSIAITSSEANRQNETSLSSNACLKNKDVISPVPRNVWPVVAIMDGWLKYSTISAIVFGDSGNLAAYFLVSVRIFFDGPMPSATALIKRKHKI